MKKLLLALAPILVFLPTNALGDDVHFEDDRYAVYDHQIRSHLPTDPGCHHSTDPECEDTSLLAWKFGPIRINHGNNSWGDALYYQLQETYTIDLKPYIESEYYMVDRLECGSTDRDVWYEEFDEARGQGVTDDYEISLENLVLTIQRGYRWDGPSIELTRGGLRLGAKPFGLMRPSLVHDALYDFPRRELVDHDRAGYWPRDRGYRFRLMADCILYALSRQDGTRQGPGLGTAQDNYFWVRAGGWNYTTFALPAWKDHATADAGPDQEIACAPPEGADVDLDGSGSTFGKDPDTKVPYYQWEWDYGLGMDHAHGERPTVNFRPGVHTVTLIVDDQDDFDDGPFGDRDKVTITVRNDSKAPFVSNPGNTSRQNETGLCSAHVEFNVTAIDDCGEPLLTCTHASGDVFPVGTTDVRCAAEDVGENTTEIVFTVTVEDTEQPVITGITEPVFVWEPSHRYVTLTVGDFVHSVTDNCSALQLDDLVITRVTSNEPDNGKGDGQTTNDIVIAADGKSVDLRAERRGKGEGRRYTVEIQAVDESGNSATVSFQAKVGHGRKGGTLRSRTP